MIVRSIITLENFQNVFNTMAKPIVPWIHCAYGNVYMNTRHTSYLSFLLHWQDFRKPNSTPKKTTKGTKNTKNVSEKVKYMHF